MNGIRVWTWRSLIKACCDFDGLAAHLTRNDDGLNETTRARPACASQIQRRAVIDGRTHIG